MPSPITHEGTDRASQRCKCHKCGIIQTCTPEHDFFSQEVYGPLYCEKCIMFVRFQTPTPIKETQTMSITKKIQQAGSVSLPRGFQQPGREVEIVVQNDNTLLLKFAPVVGHDGIAAEARSSVDIYLVRVTEGDVHVIPRLRAQLRAFDETGRIIGAWNASLLSYGMSNFYDQGKDHLIVEKAKVYFPGKKVNFIDCISDPSSVVLPNIVASALKRAQERADSGTESGAPE